MPSFLLHGPAHSPTYICFCYLKLVDVNPGIYVQDDSTKLLVLVDRSVGGTSLVDGQIEPMLHRRLIHDDVRGVDEVLNESVYVDNGCEGLTTGEDNDYSVMTSVELKMFPYKKISKVTETNLFANQEGTVMEKKRLASKVESSTEEETKVVSGGPVDPAKLVVELAPMEICTFVFEFDRIKMYGL